MPARLRHVDEPGVELGTATVQGQAHLRVPGHPILVRAVDARLDADALALRTGGAGGMAISYLSPRDGAPPSGCRHQ